MTRVPRVLVIDDEPDVRRLINRSLGYDFEVLETGDGAVALQLAEQGDIDLVIQDLKLPSADPSLTGMRLLYRIHGTLGPMVPILVVSGGDLTEVYEAGLFRALPKPFTPAPLRGLVRELVRHDRDAAAVVPHHGREMQPRPWWMAVLGWLTVIGALVLFWQADPPTVVWVAMLVFGVTLIWVGPAPADAFSILFRFFNKPK